MPWRRGLGGWTRLWAGWGRRARRQGLQELLGCGTQNVPEAAPAPHVDEYAEVEEATPEALWKEFGGPRALGDLG